MTTASVGAEVSRLLSQLPSDLYEVNGIPEGDRGPARSRAAALVEAALSDVLPPGDLRVSPLGAAWSTDLDVYLRQEASPERLRQAGWLPLDGVLNRIGSPGNGRWLVMDGDDPLVIAHLHVGDPPDPVSAVLSRARRRREVRLREVLELLVLEGEGHRLPEDPAVRIALGFAKGGEVASLPVAFGSRTRITLARCRNAAGRVKRSLRPRLVVAISGVDGAGKSTLSKLLVEDLRRACIPAERVWTRPGLRIGVLKRVSTAVKRILGDDPAPAIRRVGRGESPATVRSRRGVLGWVWSFLVTCSFVMDVRRRQLAGRGILLYDRHLLDALATLRFVYGGVETRLHEAVVRRMVPRAFATFYLALPGDVAQVRKRDEVFGAYAVSRQLEIYAWALPLIPGIHVLDALRPPTALAHDVLKTLAEAAGPQSSGDAISTTTPASPVR